VIFEWLGIAHRIAGVGGIASTITGYHCERSFAGSLWAQFPNLIQRARDNV